MKVDGIIYESTRQVIFDVVDHHGRPNIDELDVRYILILLYGLVHLFIVADPLHEILCSYFRVLSNIVWRSSFDFSDIVHDEFPVIALGFNKERLDSSSLAHVTDPLAAFPCRVGSIKDSDLSAGR